MKVYSQKMVKKANNFFQSEWVCVFISSLNNKHYYFFLHNIPFWFHLLPGYWISQTIM